MTAYRKASQTPDPRGYPTTQEREIDERIYRLYGLTQDEIRLVEESAR